MRVGIVGAGRMGRTHAVGWAATDAQLTAISSHPSSVTSGLAVEFGAIPCAGLDDLLERVDLVDVCVPAHLQHDVAVAAAKAGKHVICQQPLAVTRTQAEQVIAACREANARLLVAHIVRFFPEYAAAKAVVDSNAIGSPAVLRFTRATCQPRVGDWSTDPVKSGVVLDLMIHDFDIARWIAGDVESVFARGRPATGSNGHVEHCLAVLTHCEGAITHVEGSWAYPSPIFRSRFEIAGSSGLIDFDSDREAPVRSRVTAGHNSPEDPLPTRPLTESPHTTQLKHFLAVLRGEVTPIATPTDALAAMSIATAVAESLESSALTTVESA